MFLREAIKASYPVDDNSPTHLTMRYSTSSLLLLATSAACIPSAFAGLLAYGACQTGSSYILSRFVQS